jgi:DNA/RNA-binding domain of Phe-tRNA-synthetase-like protein
MFQYDAAILTTFPTLRGGVLIADGVNPAYADLAAISAAFSAEQAAVRAKIGATPLSEVPSLAAWRAAFRRFGADPTKYRSAAEALLRRLTKKEDIPNINPLVDLGNLISIRYGLPVAVIDRAQVATPITVRFAAGDEAYYELGNTSAVYPDQGEVIFTDTRGTVIARRWCWRQSAESAASVNSRDLLITIEGHHERAADDVSAALHDLAAMLQTHVGGQMRVETLWGTA